MQPSVLFEVCCGYDGDGLIAEVYCVLVQERLIPWKRHITPVRREGLDIGFAHQDDFAQDVSEQEGTLVVEAFRRQGAELASDRIEAGKAVASISQVNVSVRPGCPKAKQFFCPAAKYVASQTGVAEKC
jgi:hypothetical protein